MKVLLILTISCITLALCHASCITAPAEVVMKDGKLVSPDGCIDPFDGSKHSFGTEWNTKECMHCTCGNDGATDCCSRYGGIAVREGCKTVRDPETCTYKFYKADNPSIPC